MQIQEEETTDCYMLCTLSRLVPLAAQRSSVDLTACALPWEHHSSQMLAS